MTFILIGILALGAVAFVWLIKRWGRDSERLKNMETKNDISKKQLDITARSRNRPSKPRKRMHKNDL